MPLHRTPPRYRLDKVGDVIVDTRAMSTAYLDPEASNYSKGDRLFAEKSAGSPARAAFKMRRYNARSAARAAAGVKVAA